MESCTPDEWVDQCYAAAKDETEVRALMTLGTRMAHVARFHLENASFCEECHTEIKSITNKKSKKDNVLDFNEGRTNAFTCESCDRVLCKKCCLGDCMHCHELLCKRCGKMDRNYHDHDCQVGIKKVAASS